MAKIKNRLKILGLNEISRGLDHELAQAAKVGCPPTDLLEWLFSLEADALLQRRVERRIKESKLPEKKLLSDFDFVFQKGVDKAQVMELAKLDFVERKQGVIIVGSSGKKSHRQSPVAPWVSENVCTSNASFTQKDICIYNGTSPHAQAGLVQPQDKIVVRFSHTIYSYSLPVCFERLLQIFSICQILGTAGSQFVFFEVFKVNKVDMKPLHFKFNPCVITILEFYTRQCGQNIYAIWGVTKLYDLISLKKIVW